MGGTDWAPQKFLSFQQFRHLLNMFFSEISMVTKYFRIADYLFFILSRKWFHDF